MTETATETWSLHGSRVKHNPILVYLLNAKNSTIKNLHCPKLFQVQEAAWMYHALNMSKLYAWNSYTDMEFPHAKSTIIALNWEYVR